MENILPRREARENAFLLAFSQTFGDVPLAEALTNHAENDEEHPVDGFSKLLLNAYYDHSAEVDDEIRAHLRNWTMERLPRVSLTVLRLAIAEMLFGGENKPGVANLMTIYSAVTGKTFDQIETEFAGCGYGKFKPAVGEAVVETLRPIREEATRLMKDKGYLESVYKAGAEKAGYVAEKTLRKVYKKVGFVAR